MCVARTDSTSIVTRRAAGALTTPVIADAEVAVAYAMDVTMFTSLPLATRETMRARLSEVQRHVTADGTRLLTACKDMYQRVFNNDVIVDGAVQPQAASPIAFSVMQLHPKVMEYYGVDHIGYVNCIDSLIIATCDLIIVGVLCMQLDNLSCASASRLHHREAAEGGNCDRKCESSTD